MGPFIAKRLISVIPVLIGITIAAFVLLRLTGDPVALMLQPTASEEAVQAFRAELGLDQPLYVQYVRFVSGAFRGDFGRSIRYGEPVLDLFVERIPATLQLAGTTLLLSILVGIPLGVLTAVKHNTWIDNLVRLVIFISQAIPNFYLGLMLIMVVSVEWRLLPTGGRGTWQQLVLPVFTLGLAQASLIARFTRGAVLDVLHQPYIRTGRAKGLGEPYLLTVHVLKNALLPVVTIIGLQVGAIFSGAVVVETVFAWPGIGRLVVDAIKTRDFPVVQGTVMIVAFMYVMANLIVDISYGYLDPRIKHG